MKKMILMLFSLLLFIGSSMSPAWGQKDKAKPASYYIPELSSYIRIHGDSIISERKIDSADYVQDTLRAYFDYLWRPCVYKGLAAYFTYVVRAGDFWECHDYYFQLKSEFRGGFFEDRQLTIPVGPFKQYYGNGQIQNKGYFNNGKKADIWEWFNEKGQLTGTARYKDGVAIGYCYSVSNGDTLMRRLDSLGAGYAYKKIVDGRTLFIGKYLAGGIKDSIWNHYDDQGRLWYTEQFKAGKFAGQVCYDTTGAVMTTDTAYQMARFRKPVLKYLTNHVVFPRNLKLNIPSGKIVARFVVQKDGRVDNIKIVQSLEPHFDYQVVHALKHMPKWTPAKDHGRAVKSYYVVPFVFRNE